MISSFLYLTDTHLRSTNPISRRGSFEDDILAKISYCIKTARELKVDAIIHGGDLIDKPIIGVSTLLSLATLIRSWNGPWIQCIGNHDIYGGNEVTIENSYLGILSRLLGNMHTPLTWHSPDLDIDLYHYAPTREANFLFNRKTKDTIHVVHQMIVDKPFVGPYTLASDLRAQDDNQHLALCGHYHPGWQGLIECRDNLLIANPGAIARLAASWQDLYRSVQCLHVKHQPGAFPRFSVRPIHVPHRETTDAFDLKTAKNLKQDDTILTELLDLPTYVAESSTFSVEAYLHSLRTKREFVDKHKAITELERRLVEIVV